MNQTCQTTLSVLALTLLIVASVSAQQPQKPDVVRTNTELVQSAVTVVDKSGHFVEGLKREQFELLIDGKPRLISFFERISAGTPLIKETVPFDNTRNTTPATPTKPISTVRERTIVFFVDDLHLSPDSLARTRQMLHYFLENELTSTDNVAVASASGQIGFLEQFTNNKEVLKAAVDRLVPRPYFAEASIVGSSTKLTEYMALTIDTNKSDDKVLKFYIDECMKGSSTFRQSQSALALIRASCETQVKNSARLVLMQSAQITLNTYNSLGSLMRSSARAPGRKIAYFISDGFLLDAGPHAPGVRDKLDYVIDAAQRAGVVIYSIHAKGLVNQAYLDPGNSRPMDANGRLELAQAGELQANQDALNALAVDTGGRALRNTNFFERWVKGTLDEASNYYLVAWRPENSEETEQKFRSVKISVIGRSDLTVRAPRGYVDGPKPEVIVATKAKTSPPKTPDLQLRDALSDYYPAADVPTVLSLTYLSTPANGPVVTSSIQIGANGISYGIDGKQPAILRLAGVVLNDKGKVISNFGNQLNVIPPKSGENDVGVIYSQRTPLTSGIYQIRVAVRDENSARVGSAMQWIVIPNLSKDQLMTSSLLLGGQILDDQKNRANNPQVQLTGNHTFSHSSQLVYWLFVYNAKRDGKGSPHLTLQTTVQRDGQIILTSPLRTVDNGGPDSQRIPFGDELALKTLAPGRYDLTVSVKDNVAGTSVLQSSYFVVR
jgi:VWFA-related protein